MEPLFGVLVCKRGVVVVHLSELERAVFRHISQHVAQDEEVTLTELAEECHVAKGTVIKAVQKLGYRGFNDFACNVRLNAQSSDTMLLPRRIVEGDADAQAKSLAHVFLACWGKANFIFSGDRRCAALIASYMSRKLASFGLSVPPSYDYAMADPCGLEPGVAFFYFHKELPGREGRGQADDYGKGMLSTARRAGFFIVVVSDDRRRASDTDADMVVPVAQNDGLETDMFVSRVIVLLEKAFAVYSGLSRGLA